MPQFNFRARFADAVESGEKRQTVRAVRKNVPRVGQTAHLFTGLRTSAARVLGRHPIVDVRPIFIDLNRSVRHATGGDPDAVYHGRELSSAEVDAFGVADGFASGAEFIAWIEETHGLPFEGHVTYWDPSR